MARLKRQKVRDKVQGTFCPLHLALCPLPLVSCPLPFVFCKSFRFMDYYIFIDLIQWALPIANISRPFRAILLSTIIYQGLATTNFLVTSNLLVANVKKYKPGVYKYVGITICCASKSASVIFR
jgi:hypothetical protein